MRRASVRNERPPDIVDANIEALATSKRFHPIAHVLERRVDDCSAPPSPGDRALESRSDGRDNPAAEETGEVDASEADAAGGARDQNDLAGLSRARSTRAYHAVT